VKSGYLTIQAQQDKKDWVHWRTVWKYESLPKVKIFISTLLKCKVLNPENIKKNGFTISSRCSMCLMGEESIKYLFLDFSFVQECWHLLVSPLEVNMHLSQSFNEFFTTWKREYPYSLKKGKPSEGTGIGFPRFCAGSSGWQETNKFSTINLQASIMYCQGPGA